LAIGASHQEKEDVQSVQFNAFLQLALIISQLLQSLTLLAQVVKQTTKEYHDA
jgi:hypothetical protein